MKQAPKHPVRLERQGRIALIVVENPPVNALGAAVRLGIAAALNAALANDKTDAIVLAANGRTFPAGADIREFDMEPREPSLRQLCAMTEASKKPVVAALHGTALGGGLELAMAAHYRIASTDARVGLPEINLGLLPGAGGTQRLPRLVGAELAMDLMLAGAPISAGLAAEMGLLDQVTGGDLRATSVEFAKTCTEVRRTGDLRMHFADGMAYMASTNARRAQIKAEQGAAALAPLKIVDCVEAALLLPLDAGLQMERAAFEDCLASRDSAGLRHAFFAERRAGKFPEAAEAQSGQVDRIAIVGGGMMGSGIAVAALQAGYAVTVIEQGEAEVNAALERIGSHYERAVQKGRISEAQGAAALTHLQLTTKLDALDEADFIVEAVVEDLAVKISILEEISDHAREGAIIATNTSYLDLATLAEATGRPQDVVGMHFFAPVAANKLVEIAVHEGSTSQAVMTAHGVARRMGKMPVRAQTGPGFGAGYIGNALLESYRLAADIMLEEGATPTQIDGAMRAFGFPMGPYQVADMSGLDIAYARRQSQPRKDGVRYVEIADKMVQQGWLGRKAGRGYYIYTDAARHGVPNGDLLKLIETHRAENDIETRGFSDRAIRDRILLAMVNTGARLLGDGVAARPSDIDAVMMLGFGYPRARGGPMMDADATTPAVVASRLQKLASEEPSLWSVAPVLQSLAQERQKFSVLNET